MIAAGRDAYLDFWIELENHEPETQEAMVKAVFAAMLSLVPSIAAIPAPMLQERP
jgi:hypothetical protein